MNRLPYVINTEIASVLAVMRRNVRYSGYSYADPDHHLIHSLKSLRRVIFKDSPTQLDPTSLLKPFLHVIRSEDTGAPITGAALSSVLTIVQLDVLDPKVKKVDVAMRDVVEAVTGCMFEVTDPASEEAVLMKILQVLVACVKCKAGILLSDQNFCVIVNTCFRVVHQAGTKGELLQRISRQSLGEVNFMFISFFNFLFLFRIVGS